jgi:hypothetical protein
MGQTIWTSNPKDDINKVYEWEEGDMDIMRLVQGFHRDRDAQLILTNTDFRVAKKRVAKIADRIRNQNVVELGAGVGFAALEMAKVADHVTAVECDPAWSWVFCRHLYRLKPKNLTWIFDDVFEVQQRMRWCPETFDVCVVFTRSGLEQMKRYASWMAQEVIMFHQEYPDEEHLIPPCH